MKEPHWSPASGQVGCGGAWYFRQSVVVDGSSPRQSDADLLRSLSICADGTVEVLKSA